MSNQPKITYRSDTTSSSYHMSMGTNKCFIVIVERMDGSIESHIYAMQFPWRLTINRFFDIVDNHINTGECMP